MGLRGLEIWVLSTSFEKSNTGWPQQPLTERVLKFDMNFYDSTKTFFFQNIKVKPNSWTWMTLNSSVVIFQTVEPQRPQWPLQPQQPRWLQWPRQPHFIKIFIQPDGWIIFSTQMTNTSPFFEWIVENPIFNCYLIPFLSEAVEASLCYFFENWLMKLKFPNIPNPLGIIIQ